MIKLLPRQNLKHKDAKDCMFELHKFSTYYHKFIEPDEENGPEIRKMFKRLKEIDVTTVYPLLLNLYDDYAKKTINKDDFISLLKVIENYLIRRFICEIPTNTLNKIFPKVYNEMQKMMQDEHLNCVESLKRVLQGKDYPKDAQFRLEFITRKFYEQQKLPKTKLILETIEKSLEHKEHVNFSDLSIEHVLPKTLTDDWRKDLGENYQQVYEEYLDTIGNLTLTAYNSELSNHNFQEKKKILTQSKLEINKYFEGVNQWTKEEIEKRAEFLVEKALKVWSYFGTESQDTQNMTGVTGTKPTKLVIRGENYQVQSWIDVMEKTVEAICEMDPEEKRAMLLQNYSYYVGTKEDFARIVKAIPKFNIFINRNLSAENIYRFCQRIIERAGLSSEDWQVEYKPSN
ncbi:MAG: HNH endonuclease family protein [Leptospiraceae bacterium]|nr:HNH endonuclease family protein [Leptospiraceae bacterium]